MPNPEDVFDCITITDSEHPELLNVVAAKAVEMMEAIKQLRAAYREEKALPLFQFNSDLENVLELVHLIESEALKFGSPVKIRREYNEITEKEIDKIKKDKEMLLDTGLDEWVEEGLI